jgi:hypothetical protein
MTDKSTLVLGLRTLEESGWLVVCWHPVAGRVCTAHAPPARGSAAEAYSMSQTTITALTNSVLLGVDMPQVGAACYNMGCGCAL